MKAAFNVCFALSGYRCDFPGGSVIKSLPAMKEICRRCRFDPWVGKSPWSGKQQPTSLFLLTRWSMHARPPQP